jgi:hypothetical protein
MYPVNVKEVVNICNLREKMQWTRPGIKPDPYISGLLPTLKTGHQSSNLVEHYTPPSLNIEMNPGSYASGRTSNSSQ